MPFDRSTAYGQRVVQRLQEEPIIWLTTVTPGGQPLPIPVWFLWDGDAEVWIYSRPNTPKLRNIAAGAKVALNFDSDGSGGNIVQFDAEARIDTAAPLATGMDGFIAKYQARIDRMGSTADDFATNYNVAIRARLTRLRGH